MNPITMNLVADDIIRFALREDMNAGDLSTESVCPGPRKAEVQLIAKASGVIAGLDVFERTFALLDPATVSYTHLDVYKRQAPKRSRTCSVMGASGLGGNASMRP